MDLPIVPTGLSSTTSIRKLGTGIESTSKNEAAKKFETVLATLLVKEMRRSLSEGFFGEGADGDIYSGWLDDHVGQTLAQRDALHMSSMIENGVAQKAEAHL